MDCSSSTDPDGDTLTCSFELVGGAAMTGNTFTPDRNGTFVVRVIATDALGLASEPFDLTITTQNRKPTAHATATPNPPHVGDVVSIDCSSSTDPDGDALTCSFALFVSPAGSSVAMTGNTFTPDRNGTFVVRVIATDALGLASEPFDLMITTQNRKPTARATAAPNPPHVGDVVSIDCSSSTDPDGDALTCSFVLIGSSVAMTGNTFTPDRNGTFVVRVIATDALGLASEPFDLMITTQNRAPVANAGADQSVDATATVTLDGSASNDPDHDAITFAWSFVSKPPASAATLSNPAVAKPSFTADRSGEYILRLTVSDGTASSTDEVTIIVAPQRITLTLVGTPFLGIGRTAQARVTLPAPAPAGGVTVTVFCDTPALLTVVAPGTVFISEGSSTGIVSVTGVAPGEAVLRANADGFVEGTATMTVTDKLVDLPGAFSVPLGQQAFITVRISPLPAPAGGTVIRLTTSDESIIAVSAFVTILPGQFTASALVTGVRPGTAIITAENPDYATDSTPVSTAVEVRIFEASRTFFAGFPATITLDLLTAGVVVPAPSPGVVVTMTSANPGCATTPNGTFATGLSQFALAVTYGGTATLPCTTTITATSPGVAPDSVTITVNPKPGITFSGYPTTVGSGLLSTGTRFAILGASNHGGVTVHIESSDPAIALVSGGTTTVGRAFIDLAVGDGGNTVTFFVHGVEGATGNVTIQVSSSRFTSASTSVTIVQPAVQLNGVVTSTRTYSAPDPFTVSIGIPNANGANLSAAQTIRPGGNPISITVNSSNPAVAVLTTPTAVINPGQSATPNFTLQALSEGATTISVAPIAGVLSTTAASAIVNVTTPAITFSGYPTTVGAGLVSTGTRRAFLGAPNHGGVTVHIESANPAVALVSRLATTVGTPSVDIPIADGNTDVIFFVHGVEGAASTVAINVSAPGFSSASTSIPIVQPAMQLNGVDTATATFTAADTFTAQLGIPAAGNGALVATQTIRPGGQAITVTITSSNPAVATLATPALQISVGQSTTGNFTLLPLSAGSTTISIAPLPGIGNTTAASAVVNVTTPPITFSGYPTTVGAGLISTGTRRAFLGATGHGGVTVRVESANPAVALVSRNATTAGTPFIDIPIADGGNDVIFFTQGVEGATGTIQIQVSAPGFTTGTTTVVIVQPAIQLSGVDPTTTTFAGPDTFNAQIGIASASGSALTNTQTIRPGGTPITINITNSNPAVESVTPASALIGVGQSTTANFTLQTHAVGATTISVAPVAGYANTTAATVVVNVTTPAITFSGYPTTAGAGLTSTGTRRAFLGAANHGGVTVRVESSNPALALVSRTATTVGEAFVEIPIADGENDVIFVTHGLEGVSGNVVITVSAPGFSDANTTVSIQPAAIRINGLLTAGAVGAIDAFTVQIGIANATGSDLTNVGTVRPGGPPMLVALTSSNAAVGTVFSGANEGGAITLQIVPGQSQVAASFRPLASGTTQVKATGAPAVINTTAATVTRAVN
jgi:hypothetical protein